jgi:hypothetical protein
VEEDTALRRDRVERELDRLPPKVLGEFRKAWTTMRAALDDGQLEAWAQAGVELAQETVASWEAASSYFRASPQVLALMPSEHLAGWARFGCATCTESPAMAASYFEASPGAIARVGYRRIESWGSLGRGLFRGTWKSSKLSCLFITSSPALLESATLSELRQLAGFLDSLSRRSNDLALECLAVGQNLFPVLGASKGAFISLGSAVVEANWRQVKDLFEAAATSLPKIEADQRTRFLQLAERLVGVEDVNVPAAMLEVSRALGQLDGEDHGRLLGLAEELLDISPVAMPQFIGSCPQVLERVTISQVEKWFREGVRVLRRNGDGGLAYFKLESARSQEVLGELSSGVELGQVKDVMEMYCRALAGADVKLAAGEELVEKNIGWVSSEAPSTEGSTVFVASLVDRYATREENFAWCKVVATHQIAHLEFGSFRFEFDQPSTLFRDARPQIDARRSSPLGGEAREGEAVGAERDSVTDLQRFFDLFENRKLALDVFTVVEDGRLDARVKAEYQGIKGAYARVQEDSIQGRPEVRSLPMREAIVEFLVRASLQQLKGVLVPAGYVAEARKAARIARRAQRSGASVEDAAEATLRIYAIISGIPNEELGPEEWTEVDLEADLDDEDEGSYDEEVLSHGMWDGPGPDEEEYKPSQDVDFRGDFKPELVQLLEQLRTQGQGQPGEANAEPISEERLRELLRTSAELDTDAMMTQDQDPSRAFAANMLKEVGLATPEHPEYGQAALAHLEEAGGSLDPIEPQTFVYDEWDFRAGDYKPRWCIVRQRDMAEGDPGYYGSTLHSYATLAGQIKRQFELMVPEVFRKVRRLEDGDEIDIDDVIEAFVDIRTGVGPSEKLYWRRNKVERDVAVVFLLDTSASTAEAIDDSRKVIADWEAPEDPDQYMVWLRSRRGEGTRRPFKRIIDLEKEAVVLLIHALEAIGDVYGIYGFSGYGRENVEFYTIKDINEGLSEKVKNRIDRISPLHATRMGPAIRHAVSKLETQDARTKLLFLISDGRPQDRGYSREGVEKEYAVHDTKMALDEAGAKDITAFCLTVDKNGHDYLKTMCQDIGYEVLDDINALPQRLLYLYKRLTM